MKKINILFGLLFFFITSGAQRHEPVNTKTDRQEYRGYTIRLLPAVTGTFGYDIFKGPQRIVHQSRNPFNFSSRGLAQKDDAYKLAQWQITQLIGGHTVNSTKMPVTETNRKLPFAVTQQFKGQRKDLSLSNHRLSTTLARQLQITTTY